MFSYQKSPGVLAMALRGGQGGSYRGLLNQAVFVVVGGTQSPCRVAEGEREREHGRVACTGRKPEPPH